MTEKQHSQKSYQKDLKKSTNRVLAGEEKKKTKDSYQCASSQGVAECSSSEYMKQEQCCGHCGRFCLPAAHALVAQSAPVLQMLLDPHSLHTK